MKTSHILILILITILFISIYILVWSMGHNGSLRATVAVQRATLTEGPTPTQPIFPVPTDLPESYPLPTQGGGYPGPGSLSGSHAGPAFRVLLPVIIE